MSEVATTEKRRSGFSQVLRFALGLVAGAAIVTLVAVAGLAGSLGLEELSSPRAGPVGGLPPLISTHGADISKRGGAFVVLEGRDHRIRQTCRNGCDDLFVEPSLGFSKVQVVDAAGVCQLCASADRGRRPKAWTVGGQPTLALTSKDVR